MKLLSGVSEFFGLDIGTTKLRAVQLKGSGAIKALNVYGEVPLSGVLSVSEAKADRQKVTEEIRSLVKKLNITSKNVAVNLPSNRVYTSVVDIAKMAPEELAKSIRFQAGNFIPTPINQSKIDWSIIGDSPKDPTKVEILLSSVSNDFIEARLDMVEAAGLDVVAFEPDSMALVRSIVGNKTAAPEMILDIGANATDLVITMTGVPRLTRAIPTGSQSIVRVAAQSLSIPADQAEQFVFKFGLGKDKLEGQVYNAIIGTIENLMVEVEKSIAFFQARYANTKIDRIFLTGAGTSLPEFPVYLANRFGINVEIGNAWRNVSLPANKQNELLAVASQYAVAVGLAERE